MIAQGILRYTTNWCILDCEYDLGKMYRRMFLRQFGVKLQAPSWQEHITIVSNYERDKALVWGVLAGYSLEFETENTVYWNGNAVWLPVKSYDIEHLRDVMGLGPMFIPAHLCFGYFQEGNIHEIADAV